MERSACGAHVKGAGGGLGEKFYSSNEERSSYFSSDLSSSLENFSPSNASISSSVINPNKTLPLASTSCLRILAFPFRKLSSFAACSVVPSIFPSLGMASFRTSFLAFHRASSSFLESCQKLSSHISHPTSKTLFTLGFLTECSWALGAGVGAPVGCYVKNEPRNFQNALPNTPILTMVRREGARMYVLPEGRFAKGSYGLLGICFHHTSQRPASEPKSIRPSVFRSARSRNVGWALAICRPNFSHVLVQYPNGQVTKLPSRWLFSQTSEMQLIAGQVPSMGYMKSEKGRAPPDSL